MDKEKIEDALELATSRQVASELGRRKIPICGHIKPKPKICKLCSERLRIRELRANKYRGTE
jgi:hypothetical protein